MSKSPLIRKIQRSHLTLERVFYGLRSNHSNPAVLVNSFPKSGTHLLSQLFEGGELVLDFGYFLNNASSWRFSPRSEREVHRKVKNIKDGELVRAHLWYSDAISTILKEKKVNSYFIYRDLRDVVVSEVFYLTKMNRWHALHKHFHRYKGDISKALTLSIMGLPDGGESGLYQDIGKRFEPFVGWMDDTNTHAIAFETLVDKQRRHDEIVNIFRHYKPSIESFDDTLAMAMSNINPNNSHTYRKGSRGQWRKLFTDEHKEIFKEKAGELLIRLGYESDYDW